MFFKGTVAIDFPPEFLFYFKDYWDFSTYSSFYFYYRICSAIEPSSEFYLVY